ncbi:MAG: hypothetical protein NVV62_02710 [Terricaulis sp.]|nr:hypothetical protein [Terricaulis sp.]
MSKNAIAESELWAGPFPMLRTWNGDPIGERDCFLVTRGAPYNGPGLYAVRFADGAEAICRLERDLGDVRRWRVLPEGGDVQELDVNALTIIGGLEWIFRPAPNYQPAAYEPRAFPTSK